MGGLFLSEEVSVESSCGRTGASATAWEMMHSLALGRSVAFGPARIRWSELHGRLELEAAIESCSPLNENEMDDREKAMTLR